MKIKSLFLTLVLLALGGSLSSQTLTPAASSTGSITTNAANCNTTNACIILHLASSNVGYSVTASGTWTGTLTVEQSGDNQGSWTSATTTTANTLYTSALTPGITDVRVRGSAAMTGAAVVTITASGPATLQQVTGGTSGTSGVVGGTFGASPSSGYTFTSTPITLAPLGGDLLVGANINNNATGTYTAGAGYTLIGSSQVVLGMEYQLAGAATSYSAPFTYSVNSGDWGGTIATFAPSGTPTLVQGRTGAAVATLAYSSNIGAGHLLVAVFRYNSGAPIVSVADTAGNTWVSAGERCFSGYAAGVSDTNNLEVWYAMNSIAGADTVTPTYGAGNTGGVANYIGIAEFSGVATTNALVDYNFTGSTTGVTNIPGATTNTQYTINAINNKTGVVDFTGRDSAAVFRSATNVLANTPDLLFFKNGIYPGQTSLQENTGGNTNWYVWSLPAPSGGNQGSWHVVCESYTQILYTSSQNDGCIHQIMPSAYAGPQPTSNTLSGFWQRPSAGAFGVPDFFVNNTVRIPDNQHTPSISYDLFTSLYTQHIGSVADTVIVAGDQQCTGLAIAAPNITGFRTNQSLTDESKFDNTWAIGFNTPYLVLTNHPIMENVHASCNVNAGTFTSTGAPYGGVLLHYQDIHNRNGLVFNCGMPGTRFDVLNTIVEITSGSVYARVNNATEGTPGNCVGDVTVSTYTSGSAFNVLPFFNSGSGANFRVNESARVYQPGLITSNSTSAATTGTTKQTLASFNFTFTSSVVHFAGIFLNNPGAVVRITAWGITAANANSKTVEIDFGGTAISTIASTANNGTITLSADIIVGSVANTQEVIGRADDGTTRTVTRTSPGIAGNAAITALLAATTPTASGDFTFKGWTIEYLGGR